MQKRTRKEKKVASERKPRPQPEKQTRTRQEKRVAREPKPRVEPEKEEPKFLKRVWKPSTLLCPVPVVMVSCADKDGRANIVTVAWAGTVCSDPPMLSISLRKERFSHGIIKRSRQFVVNIPSIDQLRATDTCGVISGRDEDKFERTKLTAAPASAVEAPIIADCPVNIECGVRQILELGSHTMFIAEIKAVQVSEEVMTPRGRLALEFANLVAYAHGDYYQLGRKVGYFGFTVRKKK
jgi:flavin reductase (DIM6/NTAB) family NADH-FMN oxidoreductase RutF